MTKKLFAVLLGGRAPKCNTELHDVVFVAGETIEATYGQLLAKWFGSAPRLHIDSWMAVEVVGGCRVRLAAAAPEAAEKLYFMNVGAYADGKFAEIHDAGFFVAPDADAAKAMGKAALLPGWTSPVHTDDLIEVDDCLEIGTVDGLHVVLEKTGEAGAPVPVNGYLPLPKDAIAAFLAAQGAAS